MKSLLSPGIEVATSSPQELEKMHIVPEAGPGKKLNQLTGGPATDPIPSLYGIFTYIWWFVTVKYGKCR